MKRATSFIPLWLAAIAFSCGDPFAPGDVLGGTWVNTTSHGYGLQLSASGGGADYNTSCTNAHFPPLLLNDSLAFQARGVYTTAIGLVSVRIGDSATIAGRVQGDRVIIFGQGQWSFERDTLTPGRMGARVCNA
jgi:hypothetical protein